MHASADVSSFPFTGHLATSHQTIVALETFIVREQKAPTVVGTVGTTFDTDVAHLN